MKRILIALAIISILTGCYSSGIDYAKFGAGFATGLFVIHEGSHKLSERFNAILFIFMVADRIGMMECQVTRFST